MNLTKKLVSVMLSVVFLLTPFNSFNVRAASYEFTDIEKHWAQESINRLASLDIANESLSDSTLFKAEDKITRAETIELILKANLPSTVLRTALVSSNQDPFFTDTKDHSLSNYIELAHSFGIANGYTDGTFKADGSITRAEFATLVVNSHDIIEELANGTHSLLDFSDLKQSHWAYENIQKAIKSKLMYGYTDGSFVADKYMTRAEAYSLIDNYYDVCFVSYPGIVGFAEKDEKIASGMTVNLIDVTDGKVLQSVQTDKYGQFRFSPAGTSNYMIKAEEDDYLAVIPMQNNPIRKSLLESTLKLEQIVEVSGIAYANSEAIIKNTSISFESDGLQFSCLTNSDGSFENRLLPNRTYNVYSDIKNIKTKIAEITVTTESLMDLRLGYHEKETVVSIQTSSSGSKPATPSETPTYSITFETTGLGSGSVVATSGSYKAGAKLDIAATADFGSEFSGWTSSMGGSFENINAETTIFTVPANDVVVTANFDYYLDSDFDDLTDLEELNVYHTDMNLEDTDGDGANDGWEVFYGTDPLVAQGSFTQTKDIGKPNENRPVTASVTIELSGEQVGTLEINPITVSDEVLLSQAIPGYLGTAYDFSVEGEVTSAHLSFQYDSNLGEIGEDFQPRIYFFDETDGTLTELPDQTIGNGIVTANVTHFSKYILLNSVEFGAVWRTDIRKPQDNTGSGPIAYDALDVIFVVDESNSMESPKSSENDPDRLRVEAIKLFIDEMEQGRDRAGIIGFSDDARKLTGVSDPDVYDVLLDDLESVKASADLISGNIGGTQLYKGVDMAIDQFANNNRANTERIIIALTDGEDSPAAPGDAYDMSIQNAKADGITVYTIGLGNSVATILLTYLAESTGGKYFHADAAEDVYEGYELVRDETVDYIKDSNDDGISDYYSNLIFEGKLRLQNGSGEFIGTDLESLSKDIDNDGLLNGEEIVIVDFGDRVLAVMKSDPILSDSDFDGYDDKTDTHPLQPDYFSDDTSDFRFLTNDGIFQYSVEANDYDQDTWQQIGDQIVAALSFTDLQQEYTFQMVEMFSQGATQEYVDRITMSELEKAVKDGTYETIDYFIDEAFNFFDDVGDILDTESLVESGINIITAKRNLADAIATAKSTRSIAVYKGWVTRHINMFKNIEGPKLKMFTRGLPDKLVKAIDGTVDFIDNAGSYIDMANIGINLYGAFSDQEDIWNLAVGIASDNANTLIFSQNADIIIELRDNGNRGFTRSAAQFILDAMSESYLSVRQQMFDHAVINGAEIILDVALFLIPGPLWVVNIAKTVFDACDAIWGWSDTVVSRARVVCLNDMTVVANKFVNRYYLTDNEQIFGRHLKNLINLRVIGENSFIKLKGESPAASHNIIETNRIADKLGL